MAEHLFNSRGEFIAFRRSGDDKYVFDRDGSWLGWLPYGDSDVHGPSGNYIGSIVRNRLLKLSNCPYRGYAGYPGYPGYAGYPGYPGYAGPISLPPGAQDVPTAAISNFQYLFDSRGGLDRLSSRELSL